MLLLLKRKEILVRPCTNIYLCANSIGNNNLPNKPCTRRHRQTLCSHWVTHTHTPLGHWPLTLVRELLPVKNAWLSLTIIAAVLPQQFEKCAFAFNLYNLVSFLFLFGHNARARERAPLLQ